ncbi:hypothetical protein M1328_00790 [Patescibacteria group bacterium]|nr:hypothetical protein [Patescibacteria group bacterium]
MTVNKSKTIGKKLVIFFVYVLAIVVGVFVVCEAWFRFYFRSGKTVNDYASVIVDRRLWKLWENNSNDNPLLPPFRVFADTNINDLNRLKMIVKETALPKNTKLTAYNFLRPQSIKDQTAYTAAINNLGFRDPTRTVAKPKQVFRIIAFGSYLTFGHGVSDNDTYPRQLETILNQNRPDNLKFEVWNAGRDSGTAIEGLAKLETGALDYKPDLIIWDYGFVDPFIVADNDFPVTTMLKYKNLPEPFKSVFVAGKNFLADHSLFYSKVVQRLAYLSYGKNLANFMSVNEKMLQIAAANRIPVIVTQLSLPQNTNFATRQAYDKFLTNHPDMKNLVSFVNYNDVLEKYPPTEEVARQFYDQPNWLSEFPANLKKIGPWKRAEYFTDIYHYNKWGYQAIAKYLAGEISTYLKSQPFKNQ